MVHSHSENHESQKLTQISAGSFLTHDALTLHSPSSDSNVVNPNITKYVGASLILGFAIMLLLDQGFLIVKEW